jgi:hypothetical protein
LSKINKIAAKMPSPQEGEFLTFQQTEDEIIGIIGRLHDLRLASNPDIFERLWGAHIGRVEEAETSMEPYEIVPMGQDVDEEYNPLGTNAAQANDQQAGEDANIEEGEEEEEEMFASVNELRSTSLPTTAPHDSNPATSSHAAAVPFPVQLLSDNDIKKRIYPNHSSEPFNSSGNPIPTTMTQNHNIPPTLPRAMSIYITTWPPQFYTPNRAYHHPAAPVQEQDMVAFFTQVMERVGHIADRDVKGYALSYGWCDVSRWIEKTIGHGCGGMGDGVKAGESEGEKLGWHVFQKDLVDAAKKGVMMWRMKVLVVKK